MPVVSWVVSKGPHDFTKKNESGRVIPEKETQADTLSSQASSQLCAMLIRLTFVRFFEIRK